METQDVFITNDGRQRAISQLEFLPLSAGQRSPSTSTMPKTWAMSSIMLPMKMLKMSRHAWKGVLWNWSQMLSRAKFIDRVQSEIASRSALWCIYPPADDREYHYTIVGAFDADPRSGRISNESPVGRALLGHKEGDVIIVSTPGGVKEYTILRIE